MARFFSFLFISLFSLCAFSREDAEDPIDLDIRTGSFMVDEAPVFINLPESLLFLHGSDARDFLIQVWGNDPDFVKEVIGIIIPDTTQRLSSADLGYVVSYKEMGHVVDNDNYDLNKLLDSFNHRKDGYKYLWGWTPSYDKTKHILSLPLVIQGKNEIYINHVVGIFGRSGMVTLESIGQYYDRFWFQEDGQKIIDGITFTPGHRYEDFDSSKDKIAYSSVENFIQGKHAKGLNSVEGKFDFETDTIRIVGYVALVLGIILLILMGLVALTDTNKERSKDIARLSVNSLLRVCVFAVVYLLILTAAVFLVWAAFEISVWALTHVISFIISMVILVVGIFLVLLIYDIIRSLFIFPRGEKPLRVQIQEKDAPELFALIKETADAVGQKMPVKVFVSPTVNACVFYNHPLISFFFSRGKNIEIGLGLLYGLSRQELKAIIAHEFGHFGQKSMRVGQVVSAAYTVISNILSSKSTFIVTPILSRTYLYVQKSFLALNRAMENEADQVSARAVGNATAISALCKIEVIGDRLDSYNIHLWGIFETTKKVPSSYFDGYQMFQSLCPLYDGITLNATTVADKPLLQKVRSRVKLKNFWISHPLIADRIENINNNVAISSSDPHHEVVDIVPVTIKQEVSNLVFSQDHFPYATPVDNKEYLALLAKDIDEKSFSVELRDFFSHKISNFDIDDAAATETVPTYSQIFNNHNRELFQTFRQAIEDYQLIRHFLNDKKGPKEIQFDGKIYNKKNLPVAQHVNFINRMEPEIISIDRDVFIYALNISNDKQLIRKAYDDIFYAQTIIKYINKQLIPLRDWTFQNIVHSEEQSQEAFQKTLSILTNLRNKLREAITQIDMKRLDPVLNVDRAKAFNDLFADWFLNPKYESISSEEQNLLMSLPNQLIDLFHDLLYYSMKIVSDTIEGKTPLLYWNNSIASTKVKV